jgi:hypothetical protein
MTLLIHMAARRAWFVLLAMLCCRFAAASDPVHTAWIMSPSGSSVLARSLPDVHSVEAEKDYVMVRSTGISLKYFGPLQPPAIPSEGVREFVYRIPVHPESETGRHNRVPVDVIGTFVNGLPIFNHFEALSWNGANLWHYDAVACNDDGALTAAGHPRPELTHPAPAGLLEQLGKDGSRHSPLIGFALDGYPVYGPWAFSNADGSGGVRRMQSSYRLRSIARRHDWPDGTRLTPEQFGPDVSASDPLGTFVEDYEFVKGSGDLDEFNGRFARTPEYPDGIYAYFLTTDEAGRLAFPYLIGPRFYGRVPASAARRLYGITGTGGPESKGVVLSASEPQIQAGHPVHFRIEARNASGDPIRDFEYVHERPIHFVIASEDLAEFDHIHPELAADDSYEVAYTFAHGGKYRIWADYTLPGHAPCIDEFDVMIAGAGRANQKLVESSSLTQTAGSLNVTLTPSKPLRADDDIPITLKLAESLDTLEPYLGAWAHVILIGEGFRSFTHAHPIEPATNTTSLIHTHAAIGPPPNEIHIVTNFPCAGLYKLWAQFQQAGQVITVPFVLRVDAAPGAHISPGALIPTGPMQSRDGEGAVAISPKTPTIPPDAIRIRVTQHGYEPAIVEIPAETPLTLAFTRESTPNCGSEVVFPSLGIRRALPLGETVLVQLPAQPAGEISFSCGMGMFRGMMLAR